MSRARPLDSNASFEALAVSGATASLVADGLDPIPLVEHESGRYHAEGPEHIVLHDTQYDLRIVVPGAARTITASTHVPGVLTLLDARPDVAVYQGAAQFTFLITTPPTAGLQQVQFTFVTEAMDVRVEQMVPAVRDFYESDSDDLTIEDFRITGSPIVAEGNFTINADGTITVSYPWIGISFYGPNLVRLNSLDANVYDFYRSQTVQQGGSTLGPGEIPNPLERVDGAHGLFGSIARQSVQVTVLRPGA